MSYFLNKNIRKLLKKFDFFGVQFGFHYKSKSKFHTVTGGLFFIIFVIIAITYISLNIKSFIIRQNISLIYYNKQLDITDKITFENYSIAYAYGVSCDNVEPDFSIYDYIKLSLNFIILNKTGGIYNKTIIPINSDYCNESDFYNEFNSSFLSNSLQNFFCPKEKNFTMSGIYANEIFQYYEIGVSIKSDNESLFEELNNVLENSECRYEVFHIDTSINVYDYKNPVRRFVTGEFTVLKPDEFMKMNIYFKTIIFNSDENYLFNQHGNKYYLSFSSYEIYSSKKGYDRLVTKRKDFDKLAKIYFRSANEQNIVNRKYMKLSEFAANMFSLISTYYIILYAFLTYINTFYSEQSIMKKIYQFKDNKNLKSRMIIEYFKSKLLNEKTIYLKAKNKIKNCLGYTFCENNNINKNILKLTTENSKNLINNSLRHSYIMNVSNNKTNLLLNINNTKQDLNYLEGIKNNFKKANNYKQQIGKLKINKKEYICLDYNIFEILIQFLCPCISWRKLKEKNIMLQKGREKFFLHLDILSYLRKMQQLDLLCYTLLNPRELNMINFISKPSISLVNEIDLYQKILLKYNANISQKEINEFVDFVKILINKNKKTKVENNLLNIATEQLNNLIFDD